MEIHIEMVVDE
jgi:hypothetical protein